MKYVINFNLPLGTTKEFLAWLVNDAPLKIKANKHRKLRVLKKWFNRYAVVKRKGVKVSLRYNFGRLSALVACENFPITEVGCIHDEHLFLKYQPLDEDYRQFVEWKERIKSTLINEEPLGEVAWCLLLRREKVQPISYTNENGVFALQRPTIK